MVTRLILKLGRLPGADTFLSFIGRRILGAFSLIRTAILVMGIANVLLFQYLDSAEARERNKLAEEGRLDHLSFVVQTQIQSYESAVWDTGQLPGTVSSARDVYTAQATADLLALRKLDGSLVGPGGALHDFALSYLRLNQLWQVIVPTIEQGADTSRLRLLWTNERALITETPAMIETYRKQAQQDLADLQHDKENAKHAATAVSIAISLISFALSIALAITLTRQIVPPVTRLRDALQQVASGDLSPRAQVRGKDEISELLNTFNAAIYSLHNLLTQVRGHALGISTESRRLRQVYAVDSVVAGEPIALHAKGEPSSQTQPQVQEHPAQASEDAIATVTPVSAQTESTASVNQLIDQVAEVARSATLLAASARQTAATAANSIPSSDAKGALTTDLRTLDAEAKEMSEQLDDLAVALQNAQHRILESTDNLDRAAEDLREAIEQFRLQSESDS